MDACVFNKNDEYGNQITLTLHVDDILFMCKNEGSIDDVIKQIRAKYEEVTVHEGVVLSYIGMVFDFSNRDKVRISMYKYTHDLLELYEVVGTAKSPAFRFVCD